MNRLRWIVILLFILPAVANAKETLEQCKANCPPRSKECLDCCRAQDDAINGERERACTAQCQPTFKQCQGNCSNALASCQKKALESCNQIDDPDAKQKCRTEGVDACRKEMRICQDDCYRVFLACPAECKKAKLPIKGGCAEETKPKE